MDNLKDIFGLLSLIIVLVSAAPYVWSVLKGKTRPHVFTWIIWALVTGIAAAAQYAGNAGPGAWAMEAGAVFAAVTAVLSFSHGDRGVTRSDCVAFAAGLSILPLWYVTKNPLTASVLATLIDAAAYFPTFRKSWSKPGEEMAFSYLAGNARHALSIAAMTEYSATTLIPPVIQFGMNAALIALLLWRRRALAK